MRRLALDNSPLGLSADFPFVQEQYGQERPVRRLVPAPSDSVKGSFVRSRSARGAVLARVVEGGFEDPSREVGWVHVASAQDRGDAPPGEPLRILEDGGDAKRC